RTPHLRRDHVPALRPQQRVPEEHVDDHRVHRRPLGRRPAPPLAAAVRRAARGRAEPLTRPRSATTQANALVLLWVRLRSQPDIPRRRALIAACPWSRSVGGSPRSRATSMSRHPTPCPQPVPRIFIAASFAAKRAA